jgi:NADH-quinone oxidoreductase subunit L
MSILNLTWLIPLFPLLAFVAIALLADRGPKLSHRLAIGGIAISFVLSQIVFWAAVLHPVGGGQHAFESPLIRWMPIGREVFSLGVYVDPAATVMLFMVPLTCLLIFIYSVGHMHGDPRYSRFFAYISLLAAGALGLVVFNNLLAFFICWEIMSTCTYLLIGFWYEKKPAYQAGLKAFLVTKVGDLFLMLGLVLLYAEVGSLAYRDIFNPETLEHLALTPFLGTQLSMAKVIALLLFGGTVGKSAQFPLHVWLPDAMVAPTPASALIHAATVDSAGIFLMVRAFPLFAVVEGSVEMTIVGAIGAFTVILTSIIAIAQNDIKRVLAFSTVSQLGYMVAAFGVGAYVAGTFHLITHAFFKALLFLGSGSVIRGMEHGHHRARELEPGHGEHDDHGQKPFNPRDMLNMGGLAKRMPRTFWTFTAGALALSGFPLVTAGFWSKDKILAQAWEVREIFWVLAVSTGLTAFYSMRQICLTFLGQPRTMEAEGVQESVPSMTVPLIILAVFSVSLGVIGVEEDFPAIGGFIPDYVHHFVGSTIEPIEEVERALHIVGPTPEEVLELEMLPLVTGVLFGLGGLALGWLTYGRKPMEAGEMDRVEAVMRRVRLGRLYEAMRHGFYIDDLYQATIVRSSILLADLFYAFDHGVVDGLVNLAGHVGRAVSRVSDIFDLRVVGRLADLTGSGVRGLSGRMGIFDLRVVDRLADLAGSGVRGLSDRMGMFDLRVVDRLVNGVGDVVKGGGRLIRPIQTGRVQNYLLLASLMILALVLAFFLI